MSKAIPDLTRRALLIVNPIAGRKLIQRSLGAVVRKLMDGGYLATVAVTAARGEARELVSRFGRDYDLVVCAGGDGTMNECVSGMADAELHCPCSIIPCGSTNDFAVTHDLPSDILPAAEAIVSGRVRRYDIGCLEERCFLHHALFGAFTRLAYSTDQSQKNRLGFGAYVLDGLRELPNLKPIALAVTADGVREEGEYLFGAVSVNRYIVGIYTLPEELIAADDGRLAAVLIKAPKSVQDWDALGRSLISGDTNNAMVKVLVGERIEVEAKEALEWSLDGESSGPRKTVSFTARPGFLNVQG